MNDRFFPAACVGLLLAALTLAPALLAADAPPKTKVVEGRPSNVAAKPAEGGDEYPRETLPNSAGGNLSLVEARGRVATVLVCMSVECPISNEFAQTLNSLADKYRGRGVNFIGVNPNANETLQEMADHAQQIHLAFPMLKDPDGKLARRLMFQVTPEVCLFGAHGKLAYRGRIDDRYRSRGGASNEPYANDLERALEEVIAGKAVSVARTRPVGCPLQLTSSPKGGTTKP